MALSYPDCFPAEFKGVVDGAQTRAELELRGRIDHLGEDFTYEDFRAAAVSYATAVFAEFGHQACRAAGSRESLRNQLRQCVDKFIDLLALHAHSDFKDFDSPLFGSPPDPHLGSGGDRSWLTDCRRVIRGSSEWRAYLVELGDVTAARATDGDLGPTRTWGDIQVWFLSDERVEVTDGSTVLTFNYTEFGFEDSRSGKPNSAWAMLRRFAENEGRLELASIEMVDRSQVEKQIQDVRRVLRHHFGLGDDPLPFQRNEGYRAIFKLGCRQSFDT